MKQAREIYMDFMRAKQAAESLENIADRMSQTADRKMEQTMANVASNWKCESMASFQQKETALQTNIRQTAASLKNVAYSIRQDAKKMYEAEMKAYEIATKRNS